MPTARPALSQQVVGGQAELHGPLSRSTMTGAVARIHAERAKDLGEGPRAWEHPPENLVVDRGGLASRAMTWPGSVTSPVRRVQTQSKDVILHASDNSRASPDETQPVSQVTPGARSRNLAAQVVVGPGPRASHRGSHSRAEHRAGRV